MPIVFPTSELVVALEDMVAGVSLGSDTLCLFTGSHTPTMGDSTANYLGVEATFPGYFRQPVTWSPPALNSDSIAQTSGDVHLWTTTSTPTPQTISGVFALDSSLRLAWAELLPGGSIPLTVSGQTVAYQPVLTLGE